MSQPFPLPLQNSVAPVADLGAEVVLFDFEFLHGLRRTAIQTNLCATFCSYPVALVLSTRTSAVALRPPFEMKLFKVHSPAIEL